MSDVKILEHIEYTYETSDGRIFDDEAEARKWQTYLSDLETVCMLDIDREPEKRVDHVMYVHVKTPAQVEAFNEVHEYLGMYGRINEPGYYRYNDMTGKFVNVKTEIEDLQGIIDILKQGGVENV